jgi:hypothetical protein
MMTESRIGVFWVWIWGDEEIEDPKRLKSQLLSIHQAGYSAVLATLGNTRYEIIDRRVTRAVVQASQWARRRHILFWFQADPRKASRSLITKTGEKTQNLFVLKNLHDGFQTPNLNLAKIEACRFNIRCAYRHDRSVPEMQEGALSFEPSGLERAFCFKLKDGVVLNQTVRDISNETRFYANIREGYVEIFGTVSVTDADDWRVMAFPRFDTNLVDYAGRESNDVLYGLIEDLFDAGAYLNGVTWDRGGYCSEPGRLPVSLSLYNSFIADYGYDLRDRLVALVLPMDNGSHMSVRQNYYSLLMDAVCGAYHEFQRTVHGFFEGVETGIFYEWECGKSASPVCRQECMDPWRNLALSTSGMSVLCVPKSRRITPDSDALARLALAKSLGVFSSGKSAFVRIRASQWDKQTIEYWSDATALYSVRCMVDAYSETETQPTPDWNLFAKANEALKRIEDVTGFLFPEADTLLVYPYETWITADPGERKGFSDRLHRFIGRLILHGIQLDVISSVFLRSGMLSPDGFQIGYRSYRAVIYPYPEVLHPDEAEILSILKNQDFPIALGGSTSRMTPSVSSHSNFDLQEFDPESEDLSWLAPAGIRPLFQSPCEALGSMIQHLGETYLLFSPSAMGKPYQGEARYGDLAFSVPKSSRLTIYRLVDGRSAEQVI